MSTTELRALLDQVADTRELVLRRAASLGPGVQRGLRRVERRARGGRGTPTRAGAPAAARDDYAVYRAAQDREDAAQDALVRAAGR